MLRIKLLHVPFNLSILFVGILIVYLTVSLRKDYPKYKLKLIDKIKSKLLFDKIFNTIKHLPTKECSECDRANLSNNNLNISKQVSYGQTRTFQFRTVDDAWNIDNRIL